MKLQKLVESKEALQRLTKGLLPIGVAWDLKMFFKKIDTEYVSFEELKNQKIVELGEKLENGNYRVKPENIQEYYKSIEELFNKEVEVEVPQIKVDVLKDFKDKDGNIVTISVEDLMILDWLIIE